MVRNRWLTRSDREAAGFWEPSLWEKTRSQGDKAIQRLIDDALARTSITVVLIGAETASNRWVRYGIIKSHLEGRGLLGVYIDGMEDENGSLDTRGESPFLPLRHVGQDGRKVYFSELYRTYDYAWDSGFEKLDEWIESAARAAGQ